ncbi:TfoX/Sxy family protein [Ottowia pentelensis]|uniref:TfoX/Sxy family protein n=1 Tax=Ottowia pentelensis TaxID=511108 RepID=UPI0036390E13
MPTALTADSEFAQYCCELLAAIGPCHALRMFGGLGLRTADGLNVALVTDLGEGDTLWLKADAQARADFEAQGCAALHLMLMKGVPRSMGYTARRHPP